MGRGPTVDQKALDAQVKQVVLANPTFEPGEVFGALREAGSQYSKATVRRSLIRLSDAGKLPKTPGRIRGARHTAALDDAIYDELAAHPKQSVRGVFYRMLSVPAERFLGFPVTKDDAGYGAVQRRILAMRRAGRISGDWIVDASRSATSPYVHEDLSGYLSSSLNEYMYRRDWWQDLDYDVELWAESEVIAATIADAADDYRVWLCPCKGEPSETFAYERGERIAERERPVYVLYFGDHDPYGKNIWGSVQKKLRRFVDGRAPLHFHYLGLTEAQIDEHDLPYDYEKGKEKRVQAVALPVDVMRSITRDALDDYLPIDVREESNRIEARDRRTISRILAAVKQKLG